MQPALDPVRYGAAASRFRAFFDELRLAFVEREDVLRQVALSLLSREHVLLMGPPGTAKSQIATAVFGRIVDETTGEPSLYARQITESTIQTDLVGPLDFKTLMETGRTEHFTDEGMLGAVHAFLDEVFDGRDMLLRSALNVLHERELKQGTRITKGRVECALMTSNRYLSDLLESSRQTLLAFVDRIAFVGFVPRGFGLRGNLGLVLRRHAGGAARPSLEARLTIQDLDALQCAVDAVLLSDPACDALAELLDRLDVELHAASRADPAFVATRYLSTRTAVRAGRILRAIAVHDRIFAAPARPAQVLREDFAALRLHLVLAGPSPEAVEQLLSRKSDRQERRQLEILRTEREIFDRCAEKVPAIPIVKRPAEDPAGQSGGEGKKGGAAGAKGGAAGAKGGGEKGAKGGAAGANGEAADAPEVDPREAKLDAALAAGDARAVAASLRELVPVARSAQPDAERAARLVERAVAALQEQALGAALAQGDRERPRAGELQRLVALAAAIEHGGAAAQGIARWLRGRALAKVDEIATFAPGASASDLQAAAGLPGETGEPMSREAWSAEERAERRLADLEELHELRRRLLAQGTDVAEREASRAAWERAVAAAKDDTAALLDAGLRETVARVLAGGEAAALQGLLRAIGPELDRIDGMARRLSALRGAALAEAAPRPVAEPEPGGAPGLDRSGPGVASGAAPEPAGPAGARPASLKVRVVGPRLGGLVAAALERVEITDRSSLLGEIEALLATLDRAGLRGVVAPQEWMTWSTAALLRADRAPGAPPEGAAEPGYDGYRRLRAAEQRVPNTYTLAEIALRVAPEIPAAPSPADGARALAALASQIPAATRARAAQMDLARIERAASFLEAWWAALAPKAGPGEAPADPSAQLRAIIASRIFKVLWDESALSRFAAEASLIAEVFAAHAEEAGQLRERLEALDEATRKGALDLLRRRADVAWAETLAPKEG